MFDIIINPVSGKGKSILALKTVETILIGKEIPYTIHKTAYPGNAVELTRTLNKQEHTNLIVMGGDGTFNEVLNGIENFETITLGFIPCGTGNDFVKSTTIPSSVRAALELILEGNVGYCDFLQLDDKRALNCAGAGMDVDVLIRYETVKFFKGKIKYYVALISSLIHLKFHKIRMTLNGQTFEKSVFFSVVANGKYFGGGMPVSPESVVDDGRFDLVVVNEVKRRQVLPLLLKFLKGKHIGLPMTEVYRTDEVTVELLDDGKLQVDGEVFDSPLLNCKLLHNQLRVYR